MNTRIRTTAFQNILRIVLGIMMISTGIAHLTFSRVEFQAQVPNWVPLSKDLVVVLSGIVEIIFGLAMILLRKQKVWVGILLAIFFVLIFPGNIAQYVDKVDAFHLNTDKARLVRLFFQPVLIIWALWCTGALKALTKRE